MDPHLINHTHDTHYQLYEPKLKVTEQEIIFEIMQFFQTLQILELLLHRYLFRK